MTAGDAGPAPLLSVVVPTLDEEGTLPRLLSDLRSLSVPYEVVVADGYSTDGTVAAARAGGAVVLTAPRGRGSQIRAGVAASRAPWLLLLHADSRMDPPAARELERWLSTAEPHRSAYFGFALRGSGWFWRFLEFGQRLRERLTGLVYGDQGLALSREAWNAVGGAPDVALMEDVILVERLRAHGRLERLPARLETSPRRYEAEGRWLAWFRNVLLASLYRLGVPPRTLSSLYPERSGRASGHRLPAATVVAFAKAPRPGEVKTRLAADVGDAAAARFYRVLGRRVVDRLRGGPWSLVVAYAPEGARDEVGAWLGNDLCYRPQGRGDLGARMDRALTRALQESGRACVVGTDVPDLDRPLVEEALAALDDHDVAVGPAEDGGYYLLALRTPRPELFRDMPWSTDRVLSLTLGRASGLGLDVHLLPCLTDVDTVDDVPPGLRSALDASGVT